MNQAATAHEAAADEREAVAPPHLSDEDLIKQAANLSPCYGCKTPGIDTCQSCTVAPAHRRKAKIGCPVF